jgi:hypothetical protein
VKLRFTLAASPKWTTDEILLGARNVTKLSHDARTEAKKFCDVRHEFGHANATLTLA